MSGWTLGWLLWGGWFAIEETAAIRTVGTRGTLSYLLWTLGGTRRGSMAHTPGPWLRARRFALAGGLAWLCLHLLTGGLF